MLLSEPGSHSGDFQNKPWREIYYKNTEKYTVNSFKAV